MTTTRPAPWNKNLTDVRVRACTRDEITSMLDRMTELRDMAMLSLAYDASSRGHEIVAVKTRSVWRDGKVNTTPTIAGRRIKLGPVTARLIGVYCVRHELGEYLFSNRSGKGSITVRQYSRLVKKWAATIGIDEDIGTESIRRSKAQAVFDMTGDLDAARRMLGLRNFTDLVSIIDIDPCHDVLKRASCADIE